jgi:hypothetical protein
VLIKIQPFVPEDCLGGSEKKVRIEEDSFIKTKNVQPWLTDCPVEN